MESARIIMAFVSCNRAACVQPPPPLKKKIDFVSEEEAVVYRL